MSPTATGPILIVDDDPEIRDVLRIALSRAGFEVEEAADGTAALDQARRLSPALIVLDIGLPEMDGLTVCRTLRAESEVPVLFLTAQDDEVDRILGLELGADDYVTKPFSPRELVARVRAILKRVQAPREGRTARHGILEIDASAHVCRVAGQEVGLTAREMEIMSHLMARPAHVFPRPALVDAVYGTNIHVSDRTMDSHLRNLRAKLAEAGCEDAITTIHGVGIRMGACRGG